MSGPIVFMSHSQVKEGKLEALQGFSLEMFPVIQAEKPGTVLQYGYVNEEGTDLHFVHVFPDDLQPSGPAWLSSRLVEAAASIGEEGKPRSISSCWRRAL